MTSRDYKNTLMTSQESFDSYNFVDTLAQQFHTLKKRTEITFYLKLVLKLI